MNLKLCVVKEFICKIIIKSVMLNLATKYVGSRKEEHHLAINNYKYFCKKGLYLIHFKEL